MKTPAFRTYPAPLRRAIVDGVARIGAELDEGMPHSVQQVRNWLVYLAGGKAPANYYLRRADLPMFLFPWFLEKMQGKPDAGFLKDRVYSTINGFYYIRLLDDVTDHHAADEVALLPALGYLHTQFQTPYQNYFEPTHAFWDFFRRVWFHSADVTMRDLGMSRLNRKQFVQIAAQKTCAVKIPVAAVAYRYGQEDTLAGWSRFMDAYGCWHQMANDLFHWHEDLELGTATYFLSEASRRKRGKETILEWVVREGFEWGRTRLDEWMMHARKLAGALECADLVHYLHYRTVKIEREIRETRETLRTAIRLGGVLFG